MLGQVGFSGGIWEKTRRIFGLPPNLVELEKAWLDPNAFRLPMDNVEAYAAQAAQPVKNSLLEIPALPFFVSKLRFFIHPSSLIYLTDCSEPFIYITALKNSPVQCYHLHFWIS